MITAIVLSALVSLGMNYGFHVYRTQEIKKEVNRFEQKYTPLVSNCYKEFMILISEIKKDRENLF